MSLEINVTLITLTVLNLLFHSIGSFLLVTQYRNGKKTVQQMFIINLSLTELSASIVMLLEEVPELIPLDVSVSRVIETISEYIYVIIYVIFCLYYISMVYITMDRFLGILLNFKYPLYWNRTKTRYLLTTTWLVSIITCIAVCVVYSQEKVDYRLFFTKYIHSVFNFGFIALIVVTYSYIIRKFRKRATTSLHINFTDQQPQTLCNMICKEKFYVCFLLVTSFILFMVIPNLFYLFYDLSASKHQLKDEVKVFYQISFLSDAIIYIFMQPSVRRLLWKRLGVNKRPVDRTENSSQTVENDVTILQGENPNEFNINVVLTSV